MTLITNDKSITIYNSDLLEINFKAVGYSMQIKEGVPFDLWKKKFAQIRQLNGAILWYLGDMIYYAEKNYGITNYDDFDEFDYDEETLRNAAWVAKRFDPVSRITEASWSHHQVVAALPPVQANKWLQLAAKEKWSKSDLKKAIKSQDGSKVLEAPSVKLLTLFTTFKEKADEIFQSMPIKNWDSELLEKMKETFYGMIYEIESLTGWKKTEEKREFKVKGRKENTIPAGN